MSAQRAESIFTDLPLELDGISLGNLDAGKSLPLKAWPAGKNIDLVAWVENNVDFLEQALLTGGAVLFRGFGPVSVDSIERFADAVFTTRIPYEFPLTPRRKISDFIYDASLIPPEQYLGLHSECCIQRDWPMNIVFGCVSPAESGGETPLADNRKVHDRIPTEIRDRFARLGVMYEWNISNAWLSGVFGTAHPSSIEEYCDQNEYQFKWNDQGGIQLLFNCEAILEHPISGEKVWFNIATHFLGSIYPFVNSRSSIPGPVPALERETGGRFAFYGDGSPISDRDVTEIHNAFITESVTFSWQKGDIILLDNMLTVHGRHRYTGGRKILLAMGNPHQRLMAAT